MLHPRKNSIFNTGDPMLKWLIVCLSLTTQVYAQDVETTVESGFINKNSVSSTEQFMAKSKPMVYVKKIKSPLNVVYKKVFTSLDNNGYFVVFEPNIGKNLAHFAKRWGDDYNKNKLESIRSMVFCNGWYANKVSNADPNMMALCPLHITLIHKKGVTKVLFVRPGRVAVNSPAEEIAIELEQDVIRSIEEALVK